MKREQYGRGEYIAPTPELIAFSEALFKCLNHDFKSFWWLPERLDSFARNKLADAVAHAARA